MCRPACCSRPLKERTCGAALCLGGGVRRRWLQRVHHPSLSKSGEVVQQRSLPVDADATEKLRIRQAILAAQLQPDPGPAAVQAKSCQRLGHRPYTPPRPSASPCCASAERAAKMSPSPHSCDGRAGLAMSRKAQNTTRPAAGRGRGACCQRTPPPRWRPCGASASRTAARRRASARSSRFGRCDARSTHHSGNRTVAGGPRVPQWVTDDRTRTCLGRGDGGAGSWARTSDVCARRTHATGPGVCTAARSGRRRHPMRVVGLAAWR